MKLKLTFVALYKGDWRRVVLWFESEYERNEKIKELLNKYPNDSYFMKE